MLIGIIDEQIKDFSKKYYIYLSKIKDTYNLMVKCFDEDKCYFINKIEFTKVIDRFINCEKKYLEKYNEYDVYLDKFDYKHYFLNGIENYKLFYLNNGTNAIMYNKNSDDNSTKIFHFFNKTDMIIITVCCSITLYSILYSFYQGNTLNNIEYIFYDNFTNYNMSDINCKDLVCTINNNNNLTDKEKNILINEDLIEDILKVADDKKKFILNQNLKSLSIKYFNILEYKNREKNNTYGYHNKINPSVLYIKDIETEKTMPDVVTHEFCHLLQDINYIYIDEAVAEIINKEYYGYDIVTYFEEIKNVKILMEIIGPKPVFECCFSGNINSLNNAIKEYLDENDSSKLLKLFTKKTYNPNNDKEIYNLLSKMYFNKYNLKIESDIIIQTIKNDNQINNSNLHAYIINKGYFNYRFIQNQGNYIYETKNNIPLINAVNDELIEIKECFIYDKKNHTSNEISIEEALKTYEKYISSEDYGLVIWYTNLKNYDRDIVQFYSNDKGKLNPCVTISEIVEVKSIIDKFPDQFDIDNNKNISLN